MLKEMSNKVILITELPRITTPVKIALDSINMELTTDYPAISSISVMRTGISQSGKTAFIRTEFLRFIKENGFPRAIIMDCRLNPEHIPGKEGDTLKIFKTFLIAYIILHKGEGFGDIHGNFILLTKGNTFNTETGIGSNPHSVMQMLSTKNPEISIFIDELKNDRAKFNSLFRINLLDTGQSSDVIINTITSIITGVGDAAGADPAADDKVTGPDSASEEARVVCRIDGSTLYDDGAVINELTDEQLALREKEIYLYGSWVSGNEHDVSRKIASLILKGVEGKLRFSYNDVITVNLDDRCIIDKNTTLAAAQLFTKNLSAYKKIAITASPENAELIQKSRGFPMIRGIFSTRE